MVGWGACVGAWGVCVHGRVGGEGQEVEDSMKVVILKAEAASDRRREDLDRGLSSSQPDCPSKTRPANHHINPEHT